MPEETLSAVLWIDGPPKKGWVHRCAVSIRLTLDVEPQPIHYRLHMVEAPPKGEAPATLRIKHSVDAQGCRFAIAEPGWYVGEVIFPDGTKLTTQALELLPGMIPLHRD